MSWPPRTRQTAASSSSTSALVLQRHGVPGDWGHGTDKGTGGWVTGDRSYLAFLLLRLRVISLTQAGWFITRLKPDLGGKRSVNGSHILLSPPRDAPGPWDIPMPRPNPGILWDFGTSQCHVPTQ